MDVHSTVFQKGCNTFFYLFSKNAFERLFILHNLGFSAFFNHLLSYLYLFIFITIALKWKLKRFIEAHGIIYKHKKLLYWLTTEFQ